MLEKKRRRLDDFRMGKELDSPTEKHHVHQKNKQNQIEHLFIKLVLNSSMGLNNRQNKNLKETE